jgi:ariadne-1
MDDPTNCNNNNNNNGNDFDEDEQPDFDFPDDNDEEFVDDAEFGDDNDENWGDGDGDDDDGWGAVISTDDPQISNAPIIFLKQMSQVTPLTIDEVDVAMNSKVGQISEQLDIVDDKSLLLLRRYKWNSNRINDVYFTNPEKILGEAGVCMDPHDPARKSGEMECQVCYDDIDVKDAYSLVCGHQNTCKSCWVYICSTSVQTKQCVFLTCPTTKCHVVAPGSTWKMFLADHPKEYTRYLRFCRDNFVEHSKEFVFCPGKSCDMIYSSTSGSAKEVECQKCKYRFCWACKHESHYPCSCPLGNKWLTKCSSEAENIAWILAKTKRCPKCKVHIEKNQGCNHMTCRKHAGGCGYEFCWLCKGDWTKHGSSTGGYYTCNIYETNKKEGKLSKEDRAQEDAQNELDRYEFHYTRFDSHHKSCLHAIKQRGTTHERMHDLAQKFEWRLNETQFLMDAVSEAVVCWHVLAWTYAIAFYLDKKEVNVDLFKEQQGKLEHFCDGLQERLDKDLENLGVNKTRQEIIGFTRTARTYRTNLVEHIEADICIT